MKAIISDIQSKEEQAQVLGIISQYRGQVISAETTESQIIIEAKFANQEDIQGADIALCDCGFMVEWQDEN